MILDIKGQPVTDPESFMGLCFAITLLMVIVVIPSIFSKWENLLFIFIPIFLCVVMYFVCKIVPKSTFESIIDAIKKDLS
jgi:amino acid permease